MFLISQPAASTFKTGPSKACTYNTAAIPLFHGVENLAFCEGFGRYRKGASLQWDGQGKIRTSRSACAGAEISPDRMMSSWLRLSPKYRETGDYPGRQ